MSKSIIKQKRILTKASGGSSISTPVSVANGGTGLSSYAVGDLIYASGATTLSKLPIGTASQQLRVNAGATALEYFTPASSGITVGTTTITSGTSLRIPYNLAGVYQEQANFTIGSVASGFLDVPTGYAIGGIKTIVTTSAASGGIFIGYSNSTIPTPVGGSTWVGAIAGAAVTGFYNTLIGSGQYGFGAGAYNVAIGALNAAVHNSGLNSTISIGYNAVPTASNQGVLGSNHVYGYVTDWYFNGVKHTSAYSVVLNASGGSGTNNAGANITIAGGKGTGTAAGGNNVEQTSVKLASGTTLQPLTDRHNIVGKYVDLTGGAATTFANLALATSSTIAGGVIVYTVEANDGTDFQSLSGSAPYSVVNKAGTLTYVLGTDTQSSACSTGTLTGTLSLAAASTTMNFQMNAVSSLSETVLRISFQVLNNMGVAVITAA